MKSEPIITPADRVSSVKEYYFSRKLREVADMNARGLDVISLGIGGPDRMPAQEVIDTLAQEAAKEGNHSYQPYVGIPALRKAFAEWYKKWYDVVLDPNTEIQPLIGSKEGILHISLAFLNPGDGVLVPNPGYPTYTSVSNLAQAEIFTYDLKEENGWKPDFDELEKLPLDKIKLMWVNYPHMPTGTPADKELLAKIIEFGKKHNIVIAHDNPYSFILNSNPTSILSVPGAKDIAIELNSLSKSHNMAGWRIAMLASNPRFVNWILKVKSNIDSGMFKPLMLAAVKALECGSEWYDELNKVYAERRKAAEDIATALGCTFDPGQRGLFLWAKVPDSCESGEKLADEALYKARVFITPGFIFGSNGDRYIRISLCATEENMRRALDRLKEANLTKK
ncbi:MAG: aminotransferase class I/II-fold pyridoxal phosphate-dependent enzyme [Paramuribaculum sp.]|nr:aminotransferase class I/II-fold pyridoxal phosphate-dependent enzyme [Paramuribaculum sp.]